MAELKTRPTAASVEQFIEAVDNPTRRQDARSALTMLERITGESPRMWGPSMIGFGSYHYKYDSGHEGTFFRIGFSPRKAQLVFYVLTGAKGESELLARLGKHKAGKGCLYVTRLEAVDTSVLEQLCALSWKTMLERYPG